MKILIVSSSYYPEKSPRSFRTYELARELSRQGHNVEVYIPIRDVDIEAEKRNYNVNLKFIKNKTWKTLPSVIPFKRYGDRLLELFFEYPAIQTKSLVYQSLKDHEGCDLLISIAYPHTNHWGCAKLMKERPTFAKCWIADCGDPFMGSTMLTYKHPFYFKYIEKNWCNLVDYITIPIEGAKEGYYKEFHDKIRVIPQGFRMDNIRIANYIPNHVPTFAYSGGVGMGPRNPIPFIDYLLKEKYKFHFIIYTNQENFFSKYKDIDCIEIRNYIPREELLYELSKMDFLINLDNGTTRQLPSKLIDYAITGRPILNIKSADLDSTLISNFMNGDYRHKMKVKSKEDYDIINIAKKFTSLALNKIKR